MLRLVRAVACEIHEHWLDGQHYRSMNLLDPAASPSVSPVAYYPCSFFIPEPNVHTIPYTIGCIYGADTFWLIPAFIGNSYCNGVLVDIQSNVSCETILHGSSSVILCALHGAYVNSFRIRVTHVLNTWRPFHHDLVLRAWLPPFF